MEIGEARGDLSSRRGGEGRRWKLRHCSAGGGIEDGHFARAQILRQRIRGKLFTWSKILQTLNLISNKEKKRGRENGARAEAD